MDAICTGGVVAQTEGPEICVLRYGAIHIPSGITLTVTGVRAIALVATAEVSVDGTLDVSANGQEHGPGGGMNQVGSVVSIKGFGGAGFKTPGAAGATDVDGGAANGLPLIDAVNADSLLSASRGVELPGGCGGAATLISCQEKVLVAGLIDAGGGGGGGGFYDTAPRGGSGGGAGGNVVLQGRNVVVTGRLYANGGSGGAGKGDTSTTSQGQAGKDGARATTCVSGGSGVNNGGTGGAGGCTGQAPSVGGHLTATMPPQSIIPTGGGGGGSTGYLQTFTPAGVDPTITPAGVSPAFEPNGVLETH
jgi:hypothetical protein